MHALGSLIISEAGFPYWVGEHRVTLVPSRDNFLPATNAPQVGWAVLVE